MARFIVRYDDTFGQSWSQFVTATDATEAHNKAEQDPEVASIFEVVLSSRQ